MNADDNFDRDYDDTDLALTPAQRVARGVALLNEKGPPNWFLLVDPTKIVMADASTCVLGQCYPHLEWERACTEVLGITIWKSAYHGFVLEEDRDEWVKFLTEARG